MQASRRAGILVLASILAVLTIAPHHHDLLGDNVSSRGSIVERIGACHESRTHLHPARTVEQHPCVACAAQHRASVLPMFSTPAHQNVCAAASTVIFTSPRTAAIALALLRAPPL